MEPTIALVVCIVFSIALKPAIKKVPWVFYALALVLSALFASHILLSMFPSAARALYPYMQRGLLAFGLITVVMFIGVFPKSVWIRRYLNPIRGELSIIASFLAIGHIVNYLNAYVGKMLEGFVGMSISVSISIVVAFFLVALLAVLVITSFNFIKSRMDSAVWKKVQLLAYAFYVLTFVHILLILAPSMGQGGSGERALVSIVVYSLVFVAYVVARVARFALDRRYEKANLNIEA